MVSAAVLIGREGELAALTDALSRLPAVAVVEGEAGVGKTRLVTELRSVPTLTGLRFVVGSCQRIREPFPLGPVIEALRSVQDSLDARRLSPVTGALRSLLPELAPLLPEQPERLDDRAAERHRVFRGLADVLDSLGDAVLVLEDLHWADEQTVEFVGYLLRDRPSVSLLLTFRGEEVSPRVRALTATVPASVNHAHLELAPLDVAQTGALAASILGLERVSHEFAGYLCERASGLPFVIEELLALMQTRGVLIRRGGSWARKAIDELDVPAGVRDPVRERFSRLDAHAQAVAQAAAVVQIPVPLPVLVATCGLPADQVRHGIEHALASGLLVEQDGDGATTIGFRHLLAAQAVYDAMPRLRRQQLHADAASALELLDPVPLGQQAYHLRSAGQHQAWVDVADRAADQLSELGEHDEAARLLEDVLRHATLPAEHRGRVGVKLARAAARSLHPGDGTVDLVWAVETQLQPGSTRGELRFWLALLLEHTGAQFTVQRQLFAAAVDDLDDRPALQANAMAALSFPSVPGVPLAEHKRWLDRILDILPKVDDPAAQVTLLGKVAMVQVGVGDPQWRELAGSIVEQTEGLPRQPAEVAAYHSVGINACYAGHLADADRLLSAALDGAIASGNRRRELWLRATVALLDFSRGRWDALADDPEQLVDQLADHAHGRADAEVVSGCLALARGAVDMAGNRLADVVERLERRGAYDLLPLPVAALTRLRVRRNDLDAALAGVRRFVTTMDAVPFEASAARALAAATEALAAGGAPTEARDLVERWGRELSVIDAPLAPAAVVHAHGVLAAAAGEYPAAAAEFQAAVRHYERLELPYDAAQVREQRAAVLHRQGDREAAAVEIKAAMDTYQRLAASWDLDRASAAARRYGVPVPTRHRRGPKGYGTDLSPREQAVAELAAAGRTNQQIADELFVSVNTVKKQLASAMRKLGVASRSALFHRLAK